MHPVTLSQWFAFFFRAAGRIGRSEYGLGVGFLYAAAFAVIFSLATRSDADSIVAFALLFNVPFVIALWVLTVKRCHDIGLPGLYVLLLIVPIVGVVWLIALAIIPGKPGPNAYGPEPTYSA